MARGLPFSQPTEISIRRVYYRRGARRNEPRPKGVGISISDGELITDGAGISISDGVLVVDGAGVSISDGVLVVDGVGISISDGELVDVAPAAAFTFVPTALAFPDTDPGSVAELTVTVTNTGDAAGTVTGFSVMGDAYSADLVS